MDTARANIQGIELLDFYSSQEIDGRIIQLDRGKLCTEIREISFSDLFFRHFSINKSIMTEFAQPPGTWTRFYVGTKIEGGKSSLYGIPLHSSFLYVQRSGREHQCILAGGYENIDFTVSDALLEKHGIVPDRLLKRAMTGEGGFLRLPESHAAAIRNWALAIFDFVDAIDSTAIDTIHAELLRLNILDKLTGAIRLALEYTEEARAVTQYRRYHLVREALDHIKNNPSDYLTVSNLAADMGTGKKRLERGFRDVLGVSPYQYLLRDRLCSARTELLYNRHRPMVTDIAMTFGFASGSKFARHYKLLFGETPSQTINGTMSSAVCPL